MDFDLDYLLYLQEIREDCGGELLFLILSAIPLSPVTALIPAILFWCINKNAGIFIIFNGTIGRVINDLLKGIFCVYRPWIRYTELIPSTMAYSEASSWSFPSGHTQFVTSIYGSFARFYKKRAPLLILPCALVILIVAFSRNFLGVHTPQDVIIAIAYSVVLIFAAEKLFAWIGKDNERRTLFLLCGLLGTFFVFLILYFKPYPEDFMNGNLIIDPEKARIDAFDALGFGWAFFLGWFLEMRFINFKLDVSFKTKVRRIAIGIGVLAVISAVIYPLLKLLPFPAVYKFFKGFLPFFSILFVVPFIFTKVEKKYRL
ncbi:MAG: phosphatase PAP2 family protein [Selenomonadaceae bacterium]|nr:phosphatase PAP2 family protein [Selenomonadaceae bacterium]